MAELSINFAGIKSPNPFWLASGPPTNTGEQVMRAFEMGWGGAVWKTLGEPIVNVSSRLGSLDEGDRRMVGLSNIELISDRSVETNLKEISEVKKRFPDNAVIASLMVDSKEEWHRMVRLSEAAGADGVELNFGCPHGMCERGMGSAVGQEPKVMREIISWVKEVAKVPVLVKLTPNITDITEPAVAAVEAGAEGLVLINTVRSIIGVDLERLVPVPSVAGFGTPGGYSGPAVKPIALHMVSALARDSRIDVPISGLGGITTWRDAVEFISLGSTSVQVCTAVMHHGFRIIDDLVEGLSNYLDEKGMVSVDELTGRALKTVTEWGELDLDYRVAADIDPDTCIGCQICYVSCKDGGHSAIHLPDESPSPGHVAPGHRIVSQRLAESTPDVDYRVPWVDQTECVGCNLCSLVCPVPDCIRMVELK
ncbi:MAG: dihydropyrimidine dehydrogenase [Latescibacteria bacterium DG_63]|nr:MAG: dihydropyrimidine dehydrogenase [Latescibacteria bacterium DG_63]